jgi:hypothetical protein
MKTMIAVVVGLLTLPMPTGFAQAADASRDEPYPVDLLVGETFEVCKSGLIICPAIAPICDDLKVVDVVDTPDGLGFKGIASGTTLCSAGGAGGQAPRRVFRITVHSSVEQAR